MSRLESDRFKRDYEHVRVTTMYWWCITLDEIAQLDRSTSGCRQNTHLPSDLSFHWGRSLKILQYLKPITFFVTWQPSVFLSDLTPNVGLFWYFFIEMFDQFRAFFLVVFQLHAFIFAAPLTIKLMWVWVHSDSWYLLLNYSCHLGSNIGSDIIIYHCHYCVCIVALILAHFILQTASIQSSSSSFCAE